jgi:beta-fructofuranosidase
MVCYDGTRWWCYVITTELNPGMTTFFTRDNYISLFISTDFINWKVVGRVNIPKKPEELLCAGTPVWKDNKLYFFLSATITHYGEELLDQRVFLLSSENGVDFEREDSFVLEPSIKYYATETYNPENGDMMYAWRDPCLFHDPVSKKYYLYIVSGAIRWGIPPKVAVAISDSLTGPYELLPPALKFGTPNVYSHEIFFKEIERVHIHYRKGGYHLFFSTWEWNLSERCKAYLGGKGIPAVNGNVYHFISEKPEGPFKIHPDMPVIIGSGYAQLYGTQIINNGINDLLIGWNQRNYRSRVNDSLVVNWTKDAVHLSHKNVQPNRQVAG